PATGLAAILADSVVDDDRIVEAVADDRQNGRDGREAELELGETEQAEHDDHVVKRRRDRAERVAHFKADRDVQKDPDQREQYGEESLIAELATDLGSDDLDSADVGRLLGQ